MLLSSQHWSIRRSPARRTTRRSRRRRKPPPRWLHTLWLVGLLVTLLLLFLPSSKPSTHLADVLRLEGQGRRQPGEDGEHRSVGQGHRRADRQEALPVADPVRAEGRRAGRRADAAPRDDQRHLEPTSFWTVVGGLLPFVVLVGLYFCISRRATRQLAGGVMGIGASKAKVYDQQRPTTRFADVAGYEGAKREISEVVDFLKHPERYAAAGAVAPRGVLMVGPPGTGKTLLARAVAGEADVPFFALTGSSFVEMFVGVGAARVRDLFTAARKAAPAIIFIDEVDAIGQRRGGALVSNDEREQTLNQMLAEMDGFDPPRGSSCSPRPNRPETLDPALLRPGRFDRQVEIPLPNLRERTAILAVHAHGQAPRPRRRPRRGRPVDARVLRRRPRQPPERGRDRRGARRPRHVLGRRLLRGARPHPARPAGGDQRADARGEARGRGARVGPRAGRRALAERRSGREGHDPARRARRSA